MIDIHLLGHFRVFVDGTTLKFNTRPKTLSLWSYLLLNSHQPIDRRIIAYTLWPDVSEKEARANLRRHLYDLQQHLPHNPDGKAWVLIDSTTIQWNPDAPFWLDVFEFECASHNEGQLDRAVALYTGDLLLDEDEDWLLYDRERLRALYLADLSALIRIHRSAGDYQQAIQYASSLLQTDPFQEEALRQLLGLKYECGDRSGAIAEYGRFVQMLHLELGVSPMPETQAVYEAILRNRRLPGAIPTAEELHPSRRKSLGYHMAFVGQEAAFEQLTGYWWAAVKGKGGLVLIEGEAGIGKTRIASELATTAEGQGARILVGSAATGEQTPYQPYIQALGSVLPLLAALDLPAVVLAALALLLPDLRLRIPNLPNLPNLSTSAEQIRLYEAIGRCLEGLARPRPVLLILEDLQWAGTATCDLLYFLARRLEGQRIFIIGTYRGEETPRTHPLRELRRRLRRENRDRHFTLTRLSLGAVEQIVQKIPGLGSDGGTLAKQLYAGSEGNPLFICELIRFWQENGRLVPAEGQWQLAENLDSGIPVNLQQTITARVLRLTEAAKTTIEIASITGVNFDVEILREVSGWNEAQLLDSLHELIDRQLIREASVRISGDYTFTHHLIQNTVYNMVSQAVRRRRHRRVGHVLEELYPERLEELAGILARHFELGGDPNKGIYYLLRTARQALHVYANDEALAAVNRALALEPTPKDRFELLGIREEIDHRRGNRDRQKSDLEEMTRLAVELRDAEQTGLLFTRQIAFHRILGEREAERALIERFEAFAYETGQSLWQAEVIQAAAQLALTLGAFDEAQMRVEQALNLYRQMENISQQVRCHCLLTSIYADRGDLKKAGEAIKTAQGLAVQAGDYEILIETLRAAAVDAFRRNDFSAARLFHQQRLELCVMIGDRPGEADAIMNLGIIAMRYSQYSDALAMFAQAEQLCIATGLKEIEARVVMNTGALLMLTGQLSSAAINLRRAEDMAQELQDGKGQVIAAINLSGLQNRSGKYSQGCESAHRALKQAQKMKSRLFEAYALGQLGSAAFGLKEYPQAVTQFEAAIRLYREMGGPATDLCLELADLAVAQLYNRQLSSANQTVEEMLALHQAHQERVREQQRVFWAAAQVYRANGDSQRAGEMLQAARMLLQAELTGFENEQVREACLNLPFNREILRAGEENIWPD